ncbi:hypothetical protein LSAT2_001445 [Lamellibrachia satsuma]|nr:hypothetical protein LSAT2_001445 [Lamellibrachia satsuma]
MRYGRLSLKHLILLNQARYAIVADLSTRRMADCLLTTNHKAVGAVENGDSVNKASGDYGVPRRTLDTSEAWSDNRAELQWAAKQQRSHRYARLNLSST